MNTILCQQGAHAIVCVSVSITSHQSHSFHTHSTLQRGGFPSTPCCSQTLPPCLCNHDPSGQIPSSLPYLAKVLCPFFPFFQYLFIWLIGSLLQHTGSLLHYVASFTVAHNRSWDAWVQLSPGMWDPSSLTRHKTLVSCIAGWIPNHWTAREVPILLFYLNPVSCSLQKWGVYLIIRMGDGITSLSPWG